MNITHYFLSALLFPSIGTFRPIEVQFASPQGFLENSVHQLSLNKAIKSLAPIELTEDFQYPNGIAHASDGTVYVGSITSGEILKISPEGEMEIFFSGHEEVFAGTSLRLDETRGILWGASPNITGLRLVDEPNSTKAQESDEQSHRIFAIDVRSGNLLQVLPLPEGSFGNDLAIDERGGVYVTDSASPRIYYLAPETSDFQIWIEDDRFVSENIGLAGIALHSSGVMIVSKYSDGELLKITPQIEADPLVEVISLSRALENPDGIQFAPDGSLLVVEGAVETGNGRLLSIDALSSSSSPKSIQVLAENLASPVNLTVFGQEVWVTESHVRHLFIDGQENAMPEQFFIRRFPLPIDLTEF